MKLKNLFVAAVASVLAFAACDLIPEEFGLPKLSIDPLELTFGPEEKSAEVKFVCNRDWRIPVELPDWITVSPKEGKGSEEEQTVKVTVLENTGNDREATITFTADMMRASLTVRQEGRQGAVNNGTGTEEDPYSVAGVLEFIETLQPDVQSTNKVYIQGIITSVTTTFEASGTYGNATFYIADAAGSEQTFYVYQTYYLGNRKWKSGDTEVKEGDKVIICGPVVNYKGNTPETVGKGASFIYSLNGEKGEGGTTPDPETGEAKGTGTEADPFNVAAAIAKAKEAGTTPTTESYYIKGKVSKIREAFGAQYGNGSFELVDEGYSAVFVAFRILYFNNQKWDEGDKSVNVGDELVVVGKIVNYQGNTPETAQNTGYLYSLNGEKGEGGTTPDPETGEAKGTGTEADPFNVAAAIAKAKEAGTTATADAYYIKGKVSKIREAFGAQYGNGSFELVDEGYSAVFVAFRILYFNNQKWVEGDKSVNVGDELVVVGKIVNYQGNTPETAQNTGYLYSLNGEKADGSGTDPQIQEVKSVSISEFLAAAESQTQPYKLSGKMSNIKNTTYGNFDLVDVTGASVYVYGLTATDLGYGAQNDKSFSSLNLAEGDEITIIGFRSSYNGSAQVAYAYFVGKTGGTDPGTGGQGNDQEKAAPAGDGSQANPFNVSAAIDKALEAGETPTEQEFYVKGKVATVKEAFGAQYGNGTFELVDEGYTVVFTAYRILYFNNQKWVEGDAQVAVGDEIVAVGKIVNFRSNTPEIAQNTGYLYSLNGQTSIEQGPVFGVEKTEINVAATATGAVIKVTGNVPWTATSTAIIEGGSVSGNGAGEFSVAFDPNTDTENTKVYTATVVTTADVANKEIRVTITQAKASSGGGTHYEAQWLQEALAAAPAGGAVNQMDDVISFINSSSYGSTVPTELRIYKNQTLTIKAAAGYTIEDIEIGCTAAGEEKYGPGCFTVTPDGYTFNDKSGRWAGEAQEVVFTAATNQVRIVDLKVHYKD